MSTPPKNKNLVIILAAIAVVAAVAVAVMPVGLRQRLAVRVGAGEPAQIGAVARAHAGDEEAHGCLGRRWR